MNQPARIITARSEYQPGNADQYNRRGKGVPASKPVPVPVPEPEPSIYDVPLASWRTLTGGCAVLFASSITDGEVSEYLITVDGSAEIRTDSIFTARDAVTAAGY